jgi:hypothetical protein
LDKFFPVVCQREPLLRKTFKKAEKEITFVRQAKGNSIRENGQQQGKSIKTNLLMSLYEM